jgi:hypothetical protein
MSWLNVEAGTKTWSIGAGVGQDFGILVGPIIT